MVLSQQKPYVCECYNATSSSDTCVENKITCETESDKPPSCFVLWSINNETGFAQVKMKGCFTHNLDCNRTECVDNSVNKRLNFCCCHGNMCNSEYKWIPTTTKATDIEVPRPEEPSLYYIVAACCVIAFMLGGLLVGIFMFRNRKSALFNEIPTNEPGLTGSNETLNAPRPIQLLEMKARGRFGSVWRAQLKPDEVAVKIFPLRDKESWQTEQEIFKVNSKPTQASNHYDEFLFESLSYLA